MEFAKANDRVPLKQRYTVQADAVNSGIRESPGWRSPSSPSPQSWRNTEEAGEEELWEPEGWKIPGEHHHRIN